MRIDVVFNRYKAVADGPVHLYIFFSRLEKIFLHTGVNVDPRYWDSKNNRVKKSHPEFISLNLQVTNLMERIRAWEKDSYMKGLPVNKARLKAYLDGRDEGMDLIVVLRDMLETERRHLAPETVRQRESVIKNLEKFGPCPLKHIDSAWLIRYHDHLTTTMKASSTGKNHKMIKRALRRAQLQELIRNNPYDHFRIPEARKKKDFLTIEEVERIRQYKGVERLEKVRDMFIFQCLTGMAYGDMQALVQADVRTTGTWHYLMKARIKTGNMQVIPLLPEAVEILKKYGGGDNARCFPEISNQKMNAYLKEIEIIKGISLPLTTHVARHTYATLMLTKGIPLETISHVLGHSSTRITQDYARILIEKIEGDFERFNVEGL